MRVDNWPKLLNELLVKAENERFSWGEFDCFIWTSWVVERISGISLAKDYCAKFGLTLDDRPYMTTKGMMRTLKKLKCDSFFELVCKIYGEPIEAKFAQRGDLVMVSIPGLIMPSLGICRGMDAMFKTRTSNEFIPISKCKYAWRT